MKPTIKLTVGLVITLSFLTAVTQLHAFAEQDSSKRPNAASTLPVLAQIAPTSTSPSNGDVNPYGIAYVPTGFPAGGTIVAGDILVSNFNNSANLQGPERRLSAAQSTANRVFSFREPAWALPQRLAY